MHWINTTTILCMFGCFKEFRPIEPYILLYLISSKNFTVEEANRELFAISTYTNCALLIIIFLLTDFLRYNSILFLGGLSGIIVYTTLILTTNIVFLKVVGFFYGLYISTEVAYYVYIYASIDKKNYQRASAYLRSALLTGKCLTGITAQVLISYKLCDYHQLNYLTLIGQGLAVVCLFFLPSVNQSMYFHNPDNKIDANVNVNISNQHITTSNSGPKNHRIIIRSTRHACYLLWQDFSKAYTNLHVFKWSLWWIFASCGFIQELTYVQSVWYECTQQDTVTHNGAVETISTALSALAVLSIGKLHFNWSLIGEVVLSIFSIILSLLLYTISISSNIWIQYVTHIAFGIVYQAIVTICNFEVAKRIPENSYGLIFGINIFVTLMLQSLLTYIVTSGNIFTFTIREQFLIYSGYFFVLAIVFMIIFVVMIKMSYRSR